MEDKDKVIMGYYINNPEIFLQEYLDINLYKWQIAVLKLLIKFSRKQ